MSAGPFIGPRGGLWADPGHTIPWHSDQGRDARQTSLLGAEDEGVGRKQPLRTLNITEVARALKTSGHALGKHSTRTEPGKDGVHLSQHSDQLVEVRYLASSRRDHAGRAGAKQASLVPHEAEHQEKVIAALKARGYHVQEDAGRVLVGKRSGMFKSLADRIRVLSLPAHPMEPAPYAGKIEYQGLTILIENPAGSTRRGVGADGRPWKTEMLVHYGEFQGTEGVDGDPVDVFVGPRPGAPYAYVVHQRNRDTGSYDECKVLLGFANKAEALAIYRAHYDSPGWIDGVRKMPVGELREWLADPDNRGRKVTAGVGLEKGGFALATVLAKAVKGEQAGAHKYTRREPKPGGGWRYYYNESAASRGAKEGDEVRLGAGVARIHKVSEAGVEIEGAEGRRVVGHDEWAKMLAQHYGEQFYDWAEKRARQYAGAVLKHVPAEMIEDLKGDTDAARFEDLAKRLPQVHEKLQAAFRQAGISADDARRAIVWTLSRRGWTGDARSTLLGSMLDRESAFAARYYRRLGAAAENLAQADGAERVDVRHVAAALSLPRTKASMDRVVDRATAEMEHIRGILRLRLAPSEAGDGEQPRLAFSAKMGAEALAKMRAAQMIGQLQLLAQAYPGLATDPALDQLRKLLGGLQSVAPRKEAVRRGAQTTLYVAGDYGKPAPIEAEWTLVEADEAIASHDPVSFAKNAAHNVGNERAYHRDKAEQSKVISNAEGLRPDIVINTNSDAMSGAPVIDGKGIVLGGNSRTMSMQRVYKQGGAKAEELRSYLRDNARQFGFTPQDVAALKRPMLVRKVAPRDEEHRKMLVRQLNEGFTQSMDPRTMAVAQARRLDDKSLRALADSMGTEQTLATYLSGKGADEFVAELRRAGVISDQNQNAYVSQKSGRLNDQGRALVENVLVGKIVDNADLLADLPQPLVGALAQSAPYIVQAEAAGPGFGLRDDLAHALDAYTELRHTIGIPKSAKDQEEALSNFKRIQGVREVDGKLEQMPHPALRSARATAILNTLIRRSGPRQMAAVFRKYAEQAQAQEAGGGEGFSFFDKKPPDQVFREAFSRTEQEDAEARAIEEASKKPEQSEQGGLL